MADRELEPALKCKFFFVRQALRLAFLSPEVTSAILEGRQPKGLSLAQIQNCFRCRGQAVYLDGDQRAERSITSTGFFLISYFLAI
jgi:hypothetical protein